MREHYSAALRQSYELTEGKLGEWFLTFEDGVKYTMLEAVYLSRAADADIQALHEIKKVFTGEILITGVNDGMQTERWNARKAYRETGGSRGSRDRASPTTVNKADAEPIELFG